MPGMHMGLKDLRQHGGVVRDYLVCLRNACDIENAQATLIVQKRTAHEELPVSKNLVHIPAMFPIKRLLTNRLPGKPSWARGVDDDEHQWLSFANFRCASWYNALRSSPWMGGMRCWLRALETVEHSCELPGRKTISRLCVCQLFLEIAIATTSIRPYHCLASGPMERLTSGSNAFPSCSLSRQAGVPFSSSVSASRCSWTPLTFSPIVSATSSCVTRRTEPVESVLRGSMSPRIPTRAVPAGLVRLLGSRGQKLRH